MDKRLILELKNHQVYYVKNDKINYYITIPISTDSILMLHNILIGITLFAVLILYVKDNKSIIRKNNK